MANLLKFKTIVSNFSDVADFLMIYIEETYC